MPGSPGSPMDSPIIIALVGVVALALGVLLGKLLFAKAAANKSAEAEAQARKILDGAAAQAEKTTNTAVQQAEAITAKKKLEAKEHFLTLKSQHEKETLERKQSLVEAEARIKGSQQSLQDKTAALQKRTEEADALQDRLQKQLDAAAQKQEALDRSYEEHVRGLEKVAGLTADEAKAELIKAVEEEARTRAMAHVREVMEEAKTTATREAKKIIIQTIQRTGSEQTIENAVTVFHLDSDEIKGQIIGREGRNIRALEAATGVDLVVDDTPEAIVLSCFDPLRREVARLALQRLVQDGRIHPARIEEVVDKTRKALEEQVLEIGERTIIELGVHGLHKDLVRIVGKMRYRSSYGQNLLQHSKETAHLCGTMAAELGLGQKVIKLAKRAGLLHDIGKVPDEEGELSHALLGAKLAEKAGEHAAIVNAIGAHHDEMEMQYIISPIVQACDAISGARPGARREMMQSYLQRIKDLENLAVSYKGVEKAYAIQAGRELRVIVEADKMNDAQSEALSFEIADKIQKEMQFPGQIRVTVIRETRAVSVAR